MSDREKKFINELLDFIKGHKNKWNVMIHKLKS